MGMYNLPRNVKGEGRILVVFSTKALIYTFAGITIGLPFYFLMKYLNLVLIGILIVGFFGLIGFCIGTFKIPDSNAFKFTKSVGGENIDDVIIRFVKFKMAKNKIYTATKQDFEKNETKEGGKNNE